MSAVRRGPGATGHVDKEEVLAVFPAARVLKCEDLLKSAGAYLVISQGVSTLINAIQ